MLDFETQTVGRLATMVAIGDVMALVGTTLTERATTTALGRIR